MIVFSAFVPHNPLLLEEIGGVKTAKLKNTLDSFKRLEADLYASMPDSILIIGGHSGIDLDQFKLQFAPKFKTNFKDVGHFAVTKDFKPDISLIQNIKEQSMNSLPLGLSSDNTLDYGLSVPLHLLAGRMSQIKIAPLHHALLPLSEHFNLGAALRETLEHTSERVAVIAAGELSHALNKKSPGKYSPKAEAFDRLVIKSIEDHDSAKLLSLDDKYLAEIQECGLRPLAILLGIIDSFSYRTEVLSYESPFGVGHLAAEFQIR